jgi:hypothetical protein
MGKKNFEDLLKKLDKYRVLGISQAGSGKRDNTGST